MCRSWMKLDVMALSMKETKSSLLSLATTTPTTLRNVENAVKCGGAQIDQISISFSWVVIFPRSPSTIEALNTVVRQRTPNNSIRSLFLLAHTKLLQSLVSKVAEFLAHTHVTTLSLVFQQLAPSTRLYRVHYAINNLLVIECFINGQINSRTETANTQRGQTAGKKKVKPKQMRNKVRKCEYSLTHINIGWNSTAHDILRGRLLIANPTPNSFQCLNLSGMNTHSKIENQPTDWWPTDEEHKS